MSHLQEEKALTPGGIVTVRERNEPSTAIKSAVAELDLHCMYCGNSDLMKSHTETVHTGDAESYEGYEDWFCCHICRDAGEPCETFFKIPFPEVEEVIPPVLSRLRQNNRY